MRLAITSLILVVIGSLLVCAGCASEVGLKASLDRSERENYELQRRLNEREDENIELQRGLAEQQLYREKIDEEIQQMNDSFNTLSAMHEEAIARGSGYGRPLPPHLVAALKDFAENNGELLSYDSSKGLVRLNSDLTFDLGSDKVKPGAEAVLGQLGKICAETDAAGFRIIIVGHTDDAPITRAETKADHPTNWHLSVHRAIAVKAVLQKSVPEERLAVMGFGEFKPIADNVPGNKGNPLNRRVEIYIAPEGSHLPSGGL